MRTLTDGSTADPSSVIYNRCTINLEDQAVSFEEVPCQNVEDILGGFGRSFQMLAKRSIEDAYVPDNPLIVNTGVLTGSNVMTAMRTYFSGYSPLKKSDKGLPAAMWAASSGKFGAKLKWTGIDEIVFEGCSKAPVYAVVSHEDGVPGIEFKSAEELAGLTTHEKIMALHEIYPDGHFAAIGPAGENYRNVTMGAIALSTENQLKTKEDKCRFAGRGGLGNLMGYKNLFAIVVCGKDRVPAMTPEIRDVNRDLIKGETSKKFSPIEKGGGGGTWALYDSLGAFGAVPEYNFRPRGEGDTEKLSRESVEKRLNTKAEGCYRCGVRCHSNIFERDEDGSSGEFLAKFDFEPLNLLGTNIGIHDGWQAAKLVQICDNMGMDAISLGTTISYILDYNSRHPEAPILDGVSFGDYEKIHALIEKTGREACPEIGQGVKRISQQLGETSYAMHVKGLELPAYLPETNPGYAFAIAGGHMSMFTHMNIYRDGKTDLDYWVNAITNVGLYQVGMDMIGVCKFVGIFVNHDIMVRGINGANGLCLTAEEITAAVRRSYLRGLALELRQGYSDDEYSLPSQIFEFDNDNVNLPKFITPEFFAALKERVWQVFKPEMEGLLN